MVPEVETIKLSDVKFDEAIYPRKEHSPTLVQKYADCLEEIEAKANYISLAGDFTLLDGRHRQLAYTKAYPAEPDRQIQAYVYHEALSEKEKFVLAVEMNSSHGDQLSVDDKRHSAIRLYSQYGLRQDEIASRVGTSKTKINEWLRNILEAERERRDQKIFDMWLSCATQEDIAEATEMSQQAIAKRIEELQQKYLGTVVVKLLAHHEDPDFTLPLYSIWSFAKKSNEVGHFGNTEQRIVDNLLYLYTKPFDIVVDPFGGGGSTIDVCKKRLRRYWCSDRLPVPERQDIRQADIAAGPPPLHKRWQDVSLMYLDPPYWRQAQNQYSKDPEDLANMPLDRFYQVLTDYVDACVRKMRNGAHIALIIQPTQWLADDKQVVDHVFDLVQLLRCSRLRYKQRISCPYLTEQYNAQQVEWAKENKEVLILNRELIVWRVVDADRLGGDREESHKTSNADTEARTLPGIM